MSTEEIKKIKLGESVTYKCRDGKHAESVKVIAWRCGNVYPELGLRFRTKINYARSEVTVVAVPAEDTGRKRITNA